MVNPTSPDAIARWELSDPVSLTQESQTQGDSIQAAFNRRQRYDYVWADSAARTAQTGMTLSSRGYQLDTKSEYIYDNSQWRLSIPYAEFDSASVVVSSGPYVAFGALSIDSGLSTSNNFATTTGDHRITLVNPGVYSFSIFAVADTAISGIAFTMVGNNTDATTNFASQIARGPYASDNVAMTSMPFYRTSSSNSILYFYHKHGAGSNRTIYAKIRIGRLG